MVSINRLSPNRALAGSWLALAGLAALLLQPAVSTSENEVALETAHVARGSDWLTIEEGSPLLVAENSAFILTGLGNGLPGAGTQGIYTYLYIDGELELTTKANMCCGNATTIKHVPTGFTVQAGSLIEVQGSAAGLDGRGWGYLVRTSSAPDFVIVRERSPYVVPAGKKFRLIGVGSSSIFGIGYFTVNGQVEVISGTQGSGIGTSVMDVPIGFEVGAADIVGVFSNDTVNGRAWGYLAEE